ncbi:MAG: hypothetical protein PHQ66_01655 [Candidatus Nanoarchaeia archaeon]|nr:hypothetical protein [Candidatus Nanoarchaeia archaeon]
MGISIILILAYFFVVTSFFRGWQNAKLFDDIPDMIFALISLFVLCFSFKIEDKITKRYFMTGAIILAITKLAEIPMQEYQAMTGVALDFLYWAIIVFFKFVGFLCLLYGFRRNTK